MLIADCNVKNEVKEWPYDYQNVINYWQVGDWRALREFNPGVLRKREERDYVYILKFVSLLQLNSVCAAKRLLLRNPGFPRSVIRRALLSSIYNTLGRASIIQGSLERAQRHFIVSVSHASARRPPLQVIKARIQEQAHQLGFFVDEMINVKEEQGEALRSFQFRKDENNRFTRNLTLSFWLKVHKWPDKWTNVVGKLKDDSENEFCLRVKGNELGQFYCSQGGKPIVLNTWVPSEHIRVDQWVHIAVVKRQNFYCRLYIDGIIRAERDIKGINDADLVDTAVELLGSKKTGRFLDAKVKNFSLSHRALCSEDVRGLMSYVSPLLGHGVKVSASWEPFRLSPLDALTLEVESELKLRIASRVKSLDYHELIDSLHEECLTFVVVGANDGKYNDPLYDYLSNTSRKNRVVLIEPQTQLTPYLEDHYAFHPNKQIINVAIGDDGCVSLYSVKPEYWDQLDVPYATARGWPPYRAPTGVASSNKRHVQEWLNKHLKTDDVDDAIELTLVSSMSLNSVLKEAGVEGNIDVLQIDTEGFDDAIIYQSGLETIKPKLIYFEVDHLGARKKKALYDYLESQEFDVYEACENTLAIYVGGDK